MLYVPLVLEIVDEVALEPPVVLDATLQLTEADDDEEVD